jgi:hypothetical protein
MSLIENRLIKAKKLLADDGVICVTIDDYQVHELAYLLDQVFDRSNQLGTAVIRNNPSGRSTVRGFSICHEYAFFYRATEAGTLERLPRSEKQLERFTQEDGVHVDWRNFRKDGGLVTHRSERPKQFYPLFIAPDKKSFRIPELEWNKEQRKWDELEKPLPDEIVLWPIDEKGKERVWSLNHFSARESMKDLQVEVGKDGAVQVHRKHIPSDGVPNDKKVAEPLPVQPRECSRSSILVRQEYGNGGLWVAHVQTATMGNEFDQLRAVIAVADIKRKRQAIKAGPGATDGEAEHVQHVPKPSGFILSGDSGRHSHVGVIDPASEENRKTDSGFLRGLGHVNLKSACNGVSAGVGANDFAKGRFVIICIHGVGVCEVSLR